MKINGKRLAATVLKQLKKDIRDGKKKGWEAPRLVIFTVKPSDESKAYIGIKKKSVETIGGDFMLIEYKKTPRFEDFANKVASLASDPRTTGIVIQHPLPASLSTLTILDYIPPLKEIEGFKKKPEFDQPIGLAVLTMVKSVFTPIDADDPASVIVDIHRDANFFKNIFKRKRVVLLGRGLTGGQPVGDALTKAKINYINLNSQTPATLSFMEQADVIISAVGKTVVDPAYIKDGAVLLSVGLHKEGSVWVGDYNEDMIKHKVLAYSPTPGGIGPLNVAYLLHNLVRAWKLQLETRS